MSETALQSTSVQIEKLKPRISESITDIKKIIIQNVEKLSQQQMESTWNTIVNSMIGQIYEAFSYRPNEDLDACQPSLDKLFAILNTHGWTGSEFYSPPNLTKLKSDIMLQFI